MIYLVGGPPKCGKTTLAKEISKSYGIPWMSTDTLQNVIKPYHGEEDFKIKFPVSAKRYKSNDEKYSSLSTDEIISDYRTQTKTVFQAIDMFAISEITDGNDFIIEGYHIEPELANTLSEKYKGNIRSVFLVKSDIAEFIKNVEKSITPNDWIISRTTDKETYKKIAQMISAYGDIIVSEAEKYNLGHYNTDSNFKSKISEAQKYLFK